MSIKKKGPEARMSVCSSSVHCCNAGLHRLHPHLSYLLKAIWCRRVQTFQSYMSGKDPVACRITPCSCKALKQNTRGMSGTQAAHGGAVQHPQASCSLYTVPIPSERTLLSRAFYAEALQELQLRLNVCSESIKVHTTAPTCTKHKLNPAWLTRRHPSHWFLPSTITSSPMTG